MVGSTVAVTGCLGGRQNQESDTGDSGVLPEYVSPVGEEVSSSNPEGGSLTGAAIEVPDNEPDWATSDGVGFDLWYLAENQEYDTLEEENEPDHTDSTYDFYVYNGGEYEIEIETNADGDEVRESESGGLWKFPSSDATDEYDAPDEYSIYVLDGDGNRVGSVVLEGEDAHGHEVWMYGDASEARYLIGIW